MTGSKEQASGSRNYRTGVAVALVTSFLTVWTTIVRDDGHGIGFFLLILATGTGWFAAWFQPAGMARAFCRGGGFGFGLSDRSFAPDMTSSGRSMASKARSTSLS